MEELSPTAYVILGLLGWKPMSGYDIKGFVDETTRFFWAASYGQIYPELGRLSDAGLIEPAAKPEGGRRRTTHAITAKGRRALDGWLAKEPRTFEMRDEGLLKLFFAGFAPETAAAALEAKRAYHLDKLARLRQIEAKYDPRGHPRLVLRYGIESSEWMAAWCEREAKRVRG